jgi:hypothetical protein
MVRAGCGWHWGLSNDPRGRPVSRHLGLGVRIGMVAISISAEGYMTVEYSHEGPSIWGWATFRKLAKHVRVTVASRLTPTTELLLTPGFALTLEGETRSRQELEESVAGWRQEMLVGTRQCPAKHPVVPFELRVTMPRVSGKRWIQTFPNAEGSYIDYIPIPFFLCAVCQAVYRQREVEDITQASEEPASA